MSDLTLYNVLSAGARDGLVQPVTIAIPPPKLLKYKYRKMDIGVEETVSLKKFHICQFHKSGFVELQVQREYN